MSFPICLFPLSALDSQSTSQSDSNYVLLKNNVGSFTYWCLNKSLKVETWGRESVNGTFTNSCSCHCNNPHCQIKQACISHSCFKIADGVSFLPDTPSCLGWKTCSSQVCTLKPFYIVSLYAYINMPMFENFAVSLKGSKCLGLVLSFWCLTMTCEGKSYALLFKLEKYPDWYLLNSGFEVQTEI